MDLRVDIDAGACVLLALLCLTVPLNWLIAALVAAVFHELSHILAVQLTGGQIHSLSIGLSGAVMEAAPMEPFQELLSILAGPIGSFCLFFSYPVIPRIALCAFIQGIFNLMPVYPLDGGRALRCIGCFLKDHKRWEHICTAAEWTAVIIVVSFSCWACFGCQLGISPLLYGGVFLCSVLTRKISCKERNLGVQ